MKQKVVATKLIACCQRVIATRGTNIGIDELVRLSGVSKMGMYQNFVSRALLMEAIMRDVITNAVNEVISAAEKAGKSPKKRFAAAVGELALMAAGGTDINYEVLSLIQAGMPEATDPCHVFANQCKTRMAQSLETLARDCQIKDAPALVEHIITVTDGMTLRGLHHDRHEVLRSGGALLGRIIA